MLYTDGSFLVSIVIQIPESWKKTLKIVSLTGLRAYSVFPNFRNQPLLLYKSIVDEKSDESTPERLIF